VYKSSKTHLGLAFTFELGGDLLGVLLALGPCLLGVLLALAVQLLGLLLALAVDLCGLLLAALGRRLGLVCNLLPLVGGVLGEALALVGRLLGEVLSLAGGLFGGRVDLVGRALQLCLRLALEARLVAFGAVFGRLGKVVRLDLVGVLDSVAELFKVIAVDDCRRMGQSLLGQYALASAQGRNRGKAVDDAPAASDPQQAPPHSPRRRLQARTRAPLSELAEAYREPSPRSSLQGRPSAQRGRCPRPWSRATCRGEPGAPRAGRSWRGLWRKTSLWICTFEVSRNGENGRVRERRDQLAGKSE
jgi:hypothetical protein